MQVLVRDNNIDQALRLKKKMQREGVFRATRERSEAARRTRKLARKQAIRDGLIAAPKKSWHRFAKAPQCSRCAPILRQIAMR